MNPRSTKTIYYVLIAIAVFVVAAAVYQLSSISRPPIVFSVKGMLNGIWERYKSEYIEQSTLRTIDKSRNNITTSEGQSYTMLRAVWMDDQEIFDSSWQWLINSHKLQDANIFSWLYGQRSDGTYGILTEQNGQNSASDADTDVALALAFAYARWKDPKYIEASRLIIIDIWNNEVIEIGERPYLAANNVEKDYSSDIVVNPSYFAPYAYRIFARIDPAHDWNELIDTSYEILDSSMRLSLGSRQTAGLPPDWIAISRSAAQVKSPSAKGLETNFGYEALRIPWRITLDWKWYGEPRAKAALDSMSFLSREWNEKGELKSVYTHDGTAIFSTETPAMYGGTIGYFIVSDPALAKSVYEEKLLSLYSPDGNSWKSRLTYYDDNWAWFGMALYNGELPNLWATLTD